METREKSSAEMKLDVIFQIMENETFSYTQASCIVGGEARLKRLITEGKITETRPNKKWFCNAADVLRYAKIRNKSNQKNKKNERVNQSAQQE